MGNPYLNSNESIILATHRVVVKSVSSDVILTSQRLLMVDSLNSRFIPVTIPLPAIEAVMGAESTTGEPEITLSIAPPTKDEAARTLSLTFSQWEGEERTHERDDWQESLKKQIVLAREEAVKSVIVSRMKANPPVVAPDTPPESVVSEKPDISGSIGTDISHPNETGKTGLSVPPNVKGQDDATAPGSVLEKPASSLTKRTDQSAPEKPRRSPVFIVGAIGILAVVIIGAMLVLPALVPGNVTGQGNSVATLTPTTTITPNPTLTPVVTLSPTLSPTSLPTPEVSLHTTPAAPQYVVPETGVWVHVTYSRNYTGSYGTPGRMHAVTSTGNHFYNIPAVNETVEAAIQKADSSGNVLTVEVYKNGKVAGSQTTAAPQGYIDLHANLAEM